jgi:cyclic pyranopterin phosphate synthase
VDLPRPSIGDLSGLRGESRSAIDDRLRDFLVNAMWTKQAGHGIGSKTFAQPARTMSAIGG